jgi:hypothetical protein
MEIEMTEIVAGIKASSEPTLAAKLLDQFTVLDSNRHNLPIRSGSALKSTSIGNTSHLPQQLRDRSKKSKAENDAKIFEYLAEENISDKELFAEVESLVNCCRKGTASVNNCIVRNFTADDFNKTLQFSDLCWFIRWLDN